MFFFKPTHKNIFIQCVAVSFFGFFQSESSSSMLLLNLTSVVNKTNLIKYTFGKWKSSLPVKLTEGQTVYLANTDGTTTEVKINSVTNIDLLSNREEAESKILVYCKYMLRYSLRRLVLSSPDTDVLVICCFHISCCLTSLPEFWFKTGVGQKQRYIPVHNITASLRSSITKMLPVFHSITGCNSVNSFNGIGKIYAFKVQKEKKEKLIDLFEFGDNPTLDIQSEFVETCIWFVWQSDTSGINSLRYKFFTQKNKSAEKLPPTLDALILHFKRACFHMETSMPARA